MYYCVNESDLFIMAYLEYILLVVKREAHINWSMVIPAKAAPVTGTVLRTLALCSRDLGSERHRYAIA